MAMKEFVISEEDCGAGGSSAILKVKVMVTNKRSLNLQTAKLYQMNTLDVYRENVSDGCNGLSYS